MKHTNESLHLTCCLLIHLIKTDDRNDMCNVRIIWKEDKTVLCSNLRDGFRCCFLRSTDRSFCWLLSVLFLRLHVLRLFLRCIFNLLPIYICYPFSLYDKKGREMIITISKYAVKISFVATETCSRVSKTVLKSVIKCMAKTCLL